VKEEGEGQDLLQGKSSVVTLTGEGGGGVGGFKSGADGGSPIAGGE
jgi:hypothetical protein